MRDITVTSARRRDTVQEKSRRATGDVMTSRDNTLQQQQREGGVAAGSDSVDETGSKSSLTGLGAGHVSAGLISPGLTRRSFRQTRGSTSTSSRPSRDSRLQPANTVCLVARLSPTTRPTDTSRSAVSVTARSASVDRSRRPAAQHDSAGRDLSDGGELLGAAADQQAVAEHGIRATQLPLVFLVDQIRPTESLDSAVDSLVTEGVSVLAALDNALAVLTSCVTSDQQQPAGTGLVTEHQPTGRPTAGCRHVEAPQQLLLPAIESTSHVEPSPTSGKQFSSCKTVATSRPQPPLVTQSSGVGLTQPTDPTQRPGRPGAARARLSREIEAVDERRRRWQDAWHRAEDDSFNRPDSPSTPALLDDSHQPTLYSLPTDCVILRHRQRRRHDVTNSCRRSVTSSSSSSNEQQQEEVEEEEEEQTLTRERTRQHTKTTSSNRSSAANHSLLGLALTWLVSAVDCLVCNCA